MNRHFRGLVVFTFLFSFYSARAQVTAGFTVRAATPNCNPAIYSFTNTSAGIAPLTYEWNFGVYPGVNSVLKNPSTTYLGCGAFIVQLIVSDANGNKDTASQDVNVYCSPRTNFMASSTSGCVPLLTTLNSTSKAGSGSIASYLWDFGDGFTGTMSSPAHTYTSAGCKNVTLIVTNTFGCVSDTTINNVVCGTPTPVAAFSSSVNSSCTIPFTVSYQDASLGGKAPYSYHWIFSGGMPVTSSIAAPSVVYNTAGNFSATLIITDANGCTDTITKNNYITISDNKASFTLSAASGCVPSAITALGTPATVPKAWQWTVNPSVGISTPQSQNTTLSFSAPGTYTVCLDVNYGGCTVSKCDTVVIHPSPVADFTSSGLLNTCKVPQAITYINQSTGTNLTYQWSFQGGLPSNSNSSSPPAVNYANYGSYSPSLVVTDNFGCIATKTATNYVNLSCPVASFTVLPNGGCIPLSSVFNSSASTDTPTSWLWIFGDPASGTSDTSREQNPLHVFNNTGCYTITLITTNAQGCTAISTVPQAVCAGNKPVASLNANPNFTCANQPFQFTNTSTGVNANTTYQWDFTYVAPTFQSQSGQINPSYIYGDTGEFNVALIVSNYGCNDIVVMDDAVKALPPVSVPKTTSDCNGNLSVTLDGSKSLGAQHYLWSIPGGNPSSATTPIVNVTFPAAGNYTASLFITNDSTSCSDLQSVDFNISQLTADFTASPLTGCMPLNSCVINNSVGSTGSTWLVTDSAGNTAINTSISPCFLFIRPGSYNVRLVTVNALGCTDTLWKKNYIKVSQAMPNFNALFVSGCAPFRTQFMDSSFSMASTIVKWKWNFGDSLSGTADSSFQQNPSHTYNQPGDYSVILTAIDSNGCSKDLTKNLYIHVTKPQAFFTTTDTSICRGSKSCFVNNSAGGGLTYQWSFGDSGTSSSPTPCHVFTNGGTYSIQLVVTDSSGCRDTATVNNLVKVFMPDGNFKADTVSTTCPPLLVQFSNLSTNTDAGVKYLWQFGDGQISTVASPQHIYNIAGDFDVTLIVTNGSGCSDTVVIPKYIHIGGPTAYISTPPTSGCVPHFTCMVAISSKASLTWNFGDGTVQPGGDTVCYTYNLPGTFYPELILNDGASCIYSLPVGKLTVTGVAAGFNMSDSILCQNGIIQFRDSSIGNATVIYRHWDFGDPSSGLQDTSTLLNPSHFYSTNGTYPVMLTISTTDSCINSIVKNVKVTAKPPINFTVANSPICLPDTVFFLNKNIVAGMKDKWNFGDTLSGSADTSNMLNPSHYFSKPGTYSVSLTVTSGTTCADSLKLPVIVNAKPIVLATPVKPAICSGNSTIITAQGGSTYTWAPVLGLSSSTGSIVIASPSVASAYTVTGISSSGCKDTAVVSITVMALPVVIAAAVNPLVCIGSSTTLSANGAITYAWSPSNGLSSSSGSAVIAEPTGAVTYTVTGADSMGCSSSAQISLDTSSKPLLVLSFDSVICAGNRTTIVVNGANSYSWSPASGLNTITGSPVIANPDSSVIYWVVGTNGLGCVDSMPVHVKVNSPPVITATSSQSALCLGGSATITANGGDTYTWAPALGLSATTGSLVKAYPSSTTVYTIAGISANGCVDTTLVKIAVKSLPIVTAVTANPLVCNGASTVLLATGAVTYTWLPPAGLSSSSGQIVTAQPMAAVTYTVTGKDTSGCAATASVSLDTLPKPVLAISPFDSILCVGGTTTIIASGAVNYVWSPSTGLNSDTGSIVVANPDISIFYTIVGTNNAGCKDTLSTSVRVNAIPQVNAGPDTSICLGASARLRVSGEISYSWKPGSTLSSDNINNPVATPVVNTTYNVVVTNATGCTASDSFIIEVHPNPVANAGKDTLVCEGNTTILHAEGATYFSWYPGRFLSDTTISSPLCKPANNITYTVTVTDTNGCRASDDVQISVRDSFSVKANPAVILCMGDTAQLSATGWTSYTWTPRESLDNPFSASPRAWPAITTIYTVTSTDGLCFTRSDTTSVTVDPKPFLSLSANAEIVYGQNIQLQAIGNGTLSWSPPDFLNCTDCADPIAEHPDKAMTYIITLTDEAGCRVEDTVRISLVCNDDVVYIPNAFTPNGDNKNDIFRIRTYGLKQLITFRVFDRWGEIVFETNDINTGWDGTYKGQPAFPAVYDWYLEGVCSNGQKITKQGNVILIR